MGGSALLLVPSLLRDPASVYRAVGGSLSNASNFFVNYLETQALLMAPFRLLWPCSVPLKVLLGKIGRGLKKGWERSVAFCSAVVLAVALGVGVEVSKGTCNHLSLSKIYLKR